MSQPDICIIISRMEKAINSNSDQRARHHVAYGIMTEHCFTLELTMLHLAANSPSTFNWKT